MLKVAVAQFNAIVGDLGECGPYRARCASGQGKREPPPADARTGALAFIPRNGLLRRSSTGRAWRRRRPRLEGTSGNRPSGRIPWRRRADGRRYNGGPCSPMVAGSLSPQAPPAHYEVV